jgi:hypothetical protein
MASRPPYFISVRNPVQQPAIYGSDPKKGVEVRVATEQGAVILKVHRLEDGTEVFHVMRGTHVDYRGETRGIVGPVVAGMVSGGGEAWTR